MNVRVESHGLTDHQALCAYQACMRCESEVGFRFVCCGVEEAVLVLGREWASNLVTFLRPGLRLGGSDKAQRLPDRLKPISQPPNSAPVGCSGTLCMPSELAQY